MRALDAARVFDHMDDAVGVFGSDGTIVYLNPALARIYGSSALVGRRLWEAFPDAVGNEFYRRFSEVAGGGEAQRFEFFYPPFARWFENNLFRNGGRVVCIARDITERKRAAHRLTVLADASRAFAEAGPHLGPVFAAIARKLVEALGDACAVRMLTPDGARLELAAVHDGDAARLAYLRALPPQTVGAGGSTAVLASGQPLRVARLDVEEAVRTWPVLAEVLRRLRPHSTVLAPIRVGGAATGVLHMYRWEGGTPDPYTDEDLTLLADLGDRAGLAIASARAFQQAEEARRELVDITDTLPALIAAVDADGRYQFVNRQFERWFGRARSEVLGRAPREVLGEANWAVLSPHAPRALGGAPETFDARLALADGARDVRITYVPRPRGGYVAVLFDQTERVELERRKDEFLAMLGHELRNPLAPIETALHLMRLRGDPRTERERGVIERQVGHMVRLVDDLLDIARITRGKITLDREEIETAEIVARALEMTAPLLEQRGHHLEVDVPAADLPLLADGGRLAQVVANLLANAAKYTDAGGTIRVSARAEAGEVVLRVKDNGRGIAPDLLPRLFEPFTQAGQAIDRSQGGLGLGLAIVRSLVQMHGGSIEAHSEGPDRGSELVVRLPTASPPRATRVEAPPASPAPGGGGLRVLLVDDNRDAADLLAEALAASGFTARAVYDGPSALELAPSFRPAVALLDIGLPVMDGYELGLRLRELDPGVRLIALSGYAQERDREHSRGAGFEGHLAKPIVLDRLLALLAPAPAP